MLLVNHYCNPDVVTRVIVLLSWFLLIPSNSAADSLPGLNVDVLSTLKSITPSDSSKGSHDPCQVCRNLVKSFERVSAFKREGSRVVTNKCTCTQGLRLTSRGKFEGGDADWEESRLGSYQDSEVRLIEIQEKLCDDVSSGKDQCHQLAEESEALIESYWFNDKKMGVSLDDFLCIQSKGLCCRWNHFGPDCTPCPTCNSHGQCIGNGSRSGSGGCSCDTGYSGESCTECQSGFYVKQSDPVICEPCDRSCAGTCRFAGSKGCQVCREGYIWDQEYGCIDVDECIELGYNPCRKNTFCVNTQGSYQCFSKLIKSFNHCIPRHLKPLSYSKCCLKYCKK